MRPAFIATLSFVIGLAYAVLRYHDAFFGTHPSDQLPLFIFNKALSVAALFLIALAVAARSLAHYIGRLKGIKRDRRTIGLVGFVFAAVHSGISLALLTPDYYAKFYRTTGTMNLVGELSMLAGILAMTLLVWQAQLPAAKAEDDRRTLRQLGLGVLVLSAIHVAVMGWPGWFEPATWPGGLPPLTLWSFGIALTGLSLGALPKRHEG